MGLNFYIGCHRCRKRLFLFRGEESTPMHLFVRKHNDCIKMNSNSVVVMPDGYGEQDWMREYDEETLEGVTHNGRRAEGKTPGTDSASR